MCSPPEPASTLLYRATESTVEHVRITYQCGRLNNVDSGFPESRKLYQCWHSLFCGRATLEAASAKAVREASSQIYYESMKGPEAREAFR
jgi:hypothetical protein